MMWRWRHKGIWLQRGGKISDITESSDADSSISLHFADGNFVQEKHG